MRGQYGDRIRVLAGRLPVQRLRRELGDGLPHLREGATDSGISGGEERVRCSHGAIVLRGAFLDSEVHFRDAIAAGLARGGAVAPDGRVLSQHRAYFMPEGAGALAVVDADPDLPRLDGVADRLGDANDCVVDDHAVEVDLTELTGVRPHGPGAWVGALIGVATGGPSIGHQPASSTTVTPSPPPRGGAPACPCTSACFESMSRTARRSVPVPLPWMIRSSRTPARDASSSRWSMSRIASSTLRPRRSSSGETRNSKCESDG